MREKIVIIFATDHKYRYYTGVSLYSLIQHASSDAQYLIFLLAENLSEEDQGIFIQLISGKENFSLNIIDMRSKISEIGADKFYSEGNYTIANYYRLFLPEILPQYDKVLYLDSDLVIQSDIKELYSTDIGDFALAAVIDKSASFIPLKMDELNHYCYCHRVLGIRRPDRYFNSGVLIMNLKKLRNSDFPQRFRTEISSGIHFVFVDQDILNRIFEGKIFYLNPGWNHIIYKSHQGKYPILHYAGVHPWISIHKPNSSVWWDIAEKAQLAEEIRKENYCSPEQIEYLERIDKEYDQVIHSACWRFTALYRFLKDFFFYVSQYISLYKTAYINKR